MTVNIDDLEFDDCSESCFVNVCYEGKPFSGIAIDKQNDGSYEEWHFVDGFGEGRGFSLFPNGQLHEEFYLEHGIEVIEKEWTENGILILNHTEDPYLMQEFYPDGSPKYDVTQDYRRSWYRSGGLKSEYEKDKGYETQFSEDGTWISKLYGKELPLTLSRDYLEFNQQYVAENYLRLLEANRKFLWYFLLWLPEKPDEDDTDYKVQDWVADVICAMIGYKDLNIKNEGIILARDYRVISAIPLLEAESKCRKKPEDIFQDDYNVGYTFTIGKQAKISLQKLKDIE